MRVGSNGMIQRTTVKCCRESKRRNLTRALETTEAPVEGVSLERLGLQQQQRCEALQVQRMAQSSVTCRGLRPQPRGARYPDFHGGNQGQRGLITLGSQQLRQRQGGKIISRAQGSSSWGFHSEIPSGSSVWFRGPRLYSVALRPCCRPLFLG